MVSLPPRPEVITVTSESLQAKIRQLLPSQMGFGADLAAQNVIVPIIDLTASAEGSDVRQDLQTALAFGSQTAFAVNNATTTLANSPGFWNISGVVTLLGTGSYSQVALNDGATTKIIFAWTTSLTTVANTTYYPTDYTVFLGAGESIEITAGADHYFNGSYRQIADVNGNLVQPSGFTPS